MVLEEMHGGRGTLLADSIGAPDPAAVGYQQSEWCVSDDAVRYEAPAGTPSDGLWEFVEVGSAPFATRVVVRRPVEGSAASGVVVAEWLNVSSGADAAPGWGFMASEIVRAGHVWIGVSAQWAGIVDSVPLVQVADADAPISLQGLRSADPERYGRLEHPGDAYCFDMYTRAVGAIVGRGDGGSHGGSHGGRGPTGPLADVTVRRVLAAGESQSAYALTTYVNGVQPLGSPFDGFLIHSRGGPALPVGEPGVGADIAARRDEPAVRIRTDLDADVLVVQSETDVVGFLRSFDARQADTDHLRTWEVAGAAHADRSLVGEFESFLGCSEPVNRGQQRFVVRAALRRLVEWVDGSGAPGSFDPLATRGDGAAAAYVTDDVGNVVGGVRTPCVDVPTEVLSGIAGPGASQVCMLFGRTSPAPVDALRRRHPSVGAYLAAYEAAADSAIDAGVALLEDRDELLADARPDLVTW